MTSACGTNDVESLEFTNGRSDPGYSHQFVGTITAPGLGDCTNPMTLANDGSQICLKAGTPDVQVFLTSIGFGENVGATVYGDSPPTLSVEGQEFIVEAFHLGFPL